MNILDDSPLLVPLSLTTCPAVAVLSSLRACVSGQDMDFSVFSSRLCHDIASFPFFPMDVLWVTDNRCFVRA